ncbi:MAG TPA: NnrS family protein [Hyphomicrobium sp.]|nr:NnrS family protein [Hyphomicrobium sp.]HRO48694.1 NnrS family protein [Hyphomicrobium sp.]
MASSIRYSTSVLPPPEARPSFDAFFSYGFRPFFLGAAAYAVFAMLLWIGWIASVAGGLPQNWLPVAGSPFTWHAHEIVFGFAAAAIGGFLLTAVPNWTGALPLSGPPLVVLFAVWVAGRIAMGLSGLVPYTLVMIVDGAFLPLLGAFAAVQLFTRPAARNLVFLAMIVAMMVSNIFSHLGNAGYLNVDPMAAIRAAMLIVIVMIAVIGGRIIPAFTHNWLNGQRPPVPMPRRVFWLDMTALISLVVFVLFDAIGAGWVLVGTAASVAAIANGARLVLWRGFATRAEPIVWVLHVGYGWIVIGLVLAALSAFTNDVPAAVVSHAFGTGAIGTMILAVMSRASLGHTGRRLVAPRAIVATYYLVTLAAVLRVVAPLLPSELYSPMLLAAGLAWAASFLAFTLVYAPILTTPRVHMKLSSR